MLLDVWEGRNITHSSQGLIYNDSPFPGCPQLISKPLEGGNLVYSCLPLPCTPLQVPVTMPRAGTEWEMQPITGCQEEGEGAAVQSEGPWATGCGEADADTQCLRATRLSGK